MKKQRIFENNKIIFNVNKDIYDFIALDLSSYSIKDINKLIKDYGFNINKKDYLLHTQDVEMINFLISKGADFKTNPEIMIEEASLEKTKIFIKNNIDLTKINKTRYPRFTYSYRKMSKKKKSGFNSNEKDPFLLT